VPFALESDDVTAAGVVVVAIEVAAADLRVKNEK
jgi:hypothetical protein